MALEIVGREDELTAVSEFVDRRAGATAALVLEGDAGIGKSTLWLAGTEYARERGSRVLVTRPAEAERDLAHVGLGDLFVDVLGDVLPALPRPRRRALEIALLLEEAADDDAVDHRAVSVAVRDVLELLGERTPVLLAVDDVQWLDPSSSSALAFALRRLAPSRVLLLVARRITGTAEPSPLEAALAAERVGRIRVGPLSAGAVHRLLHEQLGRSFPRQTLLRIHERSGGNPFFALELARVVGVDADPLEPLPVPETLDELVSARLAGLPGGTRDALALAAALGTPSASLLERAGVATHVLEPAVDAHVIEREDNTIRFTHPLLSSALYPEPGEQRRNIHARIADVVDDPVTRARHLALSADEPSDDIAGVLDDAATLAADRGASAVAAELAEHALQLTPPHAREERHGRALVAARAHHAAGEWTRAKAIASGLVAESGVGPLRGEALVLLAELESLDRAVALLEEALHEASSRPALQATIHCRLAWSARFAEGFVSALEHARSSLQLADEVDDDALRVQALVMMTSFGTAVGDPQAREYAARAQEVAAASGDALLLREAEEAFLETRELDDLGEARALFERRYEDFRERDDLGAARALHSLAWLELWTGHWKLAAQYADRAYDLMTQYGLEVPWAHLPISVVAAHRGQLELARGHSERALQLGEEQFRRHTPVHVGTLGFVALQSGDLETALQWFAEAEAVTTRLGWHDASRRWWVSDHIEALLGLNRVDEAVRVLNAWEDERRGSDHWTLAHITRCHGLVAAARRNVGEAASLLEDAVARHENVGDGFGRARALLALGVVRRRARQKRPAREAIEAALRRFEELGAASWIWKAQAELGRIGGRTRSEGLTPAERRVASLVAEGRTNREVAAALFLGERTVETHLSHVYAKLGIRSRAELARAFRPDEQSSGEPAISS